jgi:multimeric flavodoxin WrbA
MNIVGIIASPRRQMNTDTVVQRILDGCKTSGAMVTKIYLTI